MTDPKSSAVSRRLIFLNRYFHPDHSATSQMLSDLAFALSAEGESIAVITSRQRYDAPEVRLPTRETVQGVDVFRVWTSRFGRGNLAGRAVDYLTFYMSAAGRLWRLARAGDIVIAKTDPPMLSVIAAPITRLRRATLVNWLQDIFPEVAQALEVGSGPLSRIAYRLMARVRTRSLKAAALNVALGERMDARLQGFGIKADRIRIIANWADGALLAPVEPSANAVRRSWGLSDKFVVGYSGNLGRAHDLKTLLDAIALIEGQYGLHQHTEQDGRGRTVSQNAAKPLDHTRALASDAGGGKDAADRPEVVWLFIGGGAQFETLRRDVNERGLASVHFAPYQARERLAESLSAADVHLVSFKPALEGLIVPSKIYGIAAVGRPTIFIGDPDGEIARLVARFECGLTIREGESAALARAVQDLATYSKRRQKMGANARQAFVAEFDKALAVARWQKALAELRTRRPALKSLIFTQR